MGRPARTEVPPARCGVHWPGHEVHAIQALRGLNDLRDRGVAGEVIRIEGPRVDVLVGDAIREVWTHDAGRLAALVAAEGPAVVLSERWRLLCPAPAATTGGAPGHGAVGAPGSAGKGGGRGRGPGPGRERVGRACRWPSRGTASVRAPRCHRWAGTLPRRSSPVGAATCARVGPGTGEVPRPEAGRGPYAPFAGAGGRPPERVRGRPDDPGGPMPKDVFRGRSMKVITVAVAAMFLLSAIITGLFYLFA